MEPKFIISEVFSTAWKGTKSQLWILAGFINRILYLVFHADSVRYAHAKFYYR